MLRLASLYTGIIQTRDYYLRQHIYILWIDRINSEATVPVTCFALFRCGHFHLLNLGTYYT